MLETYKLDFMYEKFRKKTGDKLSPLNNTKTENYILDIIILLIELCRLACRL